MPRPALHLCIAFCCALPLLLTSCKKEHREQQGRLETYTYTIYTPVYLNRSDIYKALNGDASEPIDSAGKIYVKGNYIYINEIDKGIHVIDNTDPSNPVQTAFIKVPGNRDIAIKSNILYADMYSELLAINIDNIHNVFITSEIPAAFANAEMPFYPSDTAGIVVGMVARDTTVTEMVYPSFQTDCPNCSFFAASTSTAKTQTDNGKAGSMARMTLINDYLYTVPERHSLSVIDVSKPEAPQIVSTVSAGFDLETIFGFKDKLFLGSEIGVYIFDVSNPVNPVSLGTFTHGRACDPVIADGNHAYVTLHKGTSCGGDANELDVLDIKDLMNPILLKTYPMNSPKGLSVDGSLLFVCDSNAVKLFNAKDPLNLAYVAGLQCPDAYDIITGGNLAMVVAKKGIYQYDYSDPRNIKLLSTFSTTID